VAARDRKCFEEGTDPTGKQYADITKLWDTNNNNLIDASEFTEVKSQMNLDGDFLETVEKSAYLLRNAWLVCRPVREQVM